LAGDRSQHLDVGTHLVVGLVIVGVLAELLEVLALLALELLAQLLALQA